MTASEGLNAVGGLLDKIAESQGRVKCGYIWTLTTLIGDISKEVAEMEAELKKLKPTPEIGIDILQNEEPNEVK